jgi:urea carboxylase
LVIVEAMKMEFEINATQAGEISAMHVEPGKAVTPGEPLLSIKV